MIASPKRLVTRVFFATFSIVLISISFLRGSYLLGLEFGLTYTGIAAGLLWLVARSLILSDRPQLVRSAVIAAVSLPVGFALAFPAAINPDIRHFIDKQAIDRAARRELAAVFASDPSYRRLSISTRHLKVVNVTIHGSLNDHSDLDRLRHRIASECPVLKQCPLHWEVMLLKPAQRIDGVDSELFQGDG